MNDFTHSFNATLHCAVDAKLHAVVIAPNGNWMTLAEARPPLAFRFEYRGGDSTANRWHYWITYERLNASPYSLGKNVMGQAVFYLEPRNVQEYWKLEVLEGDFASGNPLRCLIRDQEGQRLGFSQHDGTWIFSTESELVEFELKVISIE